MIGDVCPGHQPGGRQIRTNAFVLPNRNLPKVFGFILYPEFMILLDVGRASS